MQFSEMKTTTLLRFAPVLLVLAVVAAEPKVELNTMPIIGVLVREVIHELEQLYPGQYKSFIPASVVKFVEGGGARVVPVWLGQDEKYYQDIVTKTNGILIPPGFVGDRFKCGSADASVKLYKLAVKENERGNHYPIFSLGHGMETLLYAAAQNKIWVPCKTNQSYSLYFKPDFESSKLFSVMPSSLIAAQKNEKLVGSHQDRCLTENKLKEFGVNNNWHVLATNKAVNNVEFISALEHRKYPFYGIQFRPERNLYEWESSKSLDHSFNAILSSQYYAAFFVHEASKNANKFPSFEDEQNELIYNYAPKYTRKNHKNFFFEQCYMFESDKGTTC